MEMLTIPWRMVRNVGQKLIYLDEAKNKEIFGEIGIVGDGIGIVDLNLMAIFFLVILTPTHLKSLIGWDFCSQFVWPVISKSKILGVENWCTSLYFFLFLLAFLLLALLVAAIFGRCRLECFKGRLRKLVTWEFACSMLENSLEKLESAPGKLSTTFFQSTGKRSFHYFS